MLLNRLDVGIVKSTGSSYVLSQVYLCTNSVIRRPLKGFTWQITSRSTRCPATIKNAKDNTKMSLVYRCFWETLSMSKIQYMSMNSDKRQESNGKIVCLAAYKWVFVYLLYIYILLNTLFVGAIISHCYCPPFYLCWHSEILPSLTRGPLYLMQRLQLEPPIGHSQTLVLDTGSLHFLCASLFIWIIMGMFISHNY